MAVGKRDKKGRGKRRDREGAGKKNLNGYGNGGKAVLQNNVIFSYLINYTINKAAQSIPYMSLCKLYATAPHSSATAVISLFTYSSTVAHTHNYFPLMGHSMSHEWKIIVS